MHLIQILLPLYDNAGFPFPQMTYEKVRDELTDRFGGITTYLRSPAEGLWKEGEGKPVRDEIVIFEVMTETVDREWWVMFRRGLESQFRQESLIVRVFRIEIV